MTEIRDSWREVAAKAESIGLKLRLHLDQEDAARPPDEGPTAGPEPEETPPTGGTRAAIDELGTKLKDAIEAFGAAAKDPAVRSDVADMGLLLKDALVSTLTAVGADVSEAAKGVGDVVRKAGTRPTDSTPPPPSSPPPPSAPEGTVADGDDAG